MDRVKSACIGSLTSMFSDSYGNLFKCLWRRQNYDNATRRKETKEITNNIVVLLSAIVLAIAAGIPLPIIGVIFGKIINEFPPQESELRERLGQLMIVAVVYFFVTWGWSCCWGVIGERISKYYREDLLTKAIMMDLTYHELHCPDVTTYLTADTQSIQLGTSEKTGLFIQSISYFVAAFTVGFILNARLTGILFAAVIPAIALTIIIGSREVSKYAKRASEMSSKGTNLLGGAVRGIQVVKALDCSRALADIHSRFVQAAENSGVKKGISSAIMLGLVYFISYAANALAFWEGSRMITNGNLEKGQAGTIYAVVFLILDASYVVGQFGPFLQVFSVAAAAGERIDKVLHSTPSDIDISSHKGLLLQANDSRQLILDNVDFSYPTRRSVQVLKHVSMNFDHGAFTAIVGMSGSGKSTIANLLMRFYDPSSGCITVAGKALAELNLPKYRAGVSLVDQRSCLFSGTIQENILHGLRSTDNQSQAELDALCANAAEEANALSFIKALPHGFNTRIESQSSAQLSGGQQARIALARALISKPQILVLDEPTAALDSKSENLILDSLFKTQKSYPRTTILITHRLASVQRADKIIVMMDGEVVEQGAYEELMAKEGAFSDLVSAQTSSSASTDTDDTKVASSSDIEDLDEKTSYTKKEKQQKRISDIGSIAVPDESENLPLRILIRRCLILSCSDWPYLVAGLLCSMLTGGIVVGESIVFGHIITVINGTEDLESLQSQANFYCLMFLVLALVALIAFTTSGICYGIVNERLTKRLQIASFSTIMKQDMSWFEMPKYSGNALMSLCQTTTGSISGLSGIFIGTIISILVSMIGGIVLAHILAWKVAIVILAAVPVMIFAGFLRLRVLAKANERHETSYMEAAALAAEACRELRTISALGCEKAVIQNYEASLAKPYKESLKFNIIGNIWLAFALSITYFVYSLAYWWGARQVRQGNCTVQNFFIILPALLFSAQASGQMFSLAPELTKARSAAQKIFSLHDQQPNMVEGAEEVLNQDSSTQKPSEKGLVEYRDVHFKYPSRPNIPVLKGINLTIQPGKFIAIVGESGAGKSSMIALLERFYDNQSGAVLIDEQNIRNLKFKAHRQRISLVPQTSILFYGTLSFNIALGMPDTSEVSQKQIEEVCKRCDIHEFIMSLPDGYQTDCARSGLEFSGGQLQRIAIARALIRNPTLMLLDEATSALDPHSELTVMEAIKTASEGRTTIMVTHRLATIQDADCIYVMQNGFIEEAGKHEELMCNNGVYASMYKHQSFS